MTLDLHNSDLHDTSHERTPVLTAPELVPELMARTQWTPERLAVHQREQLDALLRHAVEHSPYYRQAFGSAAAHGGVALDELPTLDKATLMEHFDDIVTDRRINRPAAEAILSGEVPEGDHVILATSGTTGQRGIFIYARPEFTVSVANFLRTLALVGVTPDLKLAAIGAPGPQHLSRRWIAEITKGTATENSEAPRLSVTTPLPELVAELNASPPDVLATYPSIAALLAEERLAGRLDITPATIGTSAEVLTADMHQRIREAWDVEPQQLYAATESLLAATCTQHVGMHLLEDLVLIEVVDENNRPVPPGVPSHKILITSLVNRVQPLIRYEISDSVTLAEGPNPTGMPFRRITSVNGRSDDILTLPAPDGRTVAIHPIHLHAPFSTLPGVVQYQLTYDGAGLTVRIVPGRGAGQDLDERVRTALRNALRDSGAVPPPVTVELAAELPREPGHAGKFKTLKTNPLTTSDQRERLLGDQ